VARISKVAADRIPRTRMVLQQIMQPSVVSTQDADS